MAKQVKSRWVKYCDQCGSAVEELYVKNTNPREGDDMMWQTMSHDCISYLKNRIEDLEKAVSRLEAHIDCEDW